MSVPYLSLCPLLLSPQRLPAPAGEEPAGPPPPPAVSLSVPWLCPRLLFVSALHLPPGGFSSCWAKGGPFELVPCAGPAGGCEVPGTWDLYSMRGVGR